MYNFSSILDIVIEEAPLSSYSSADDAFNIVNKLEQTNQLVNKLKRDLQIAQNKMCGELALNIRRKMPSLNVSVNRDGCKIGYKSKHLLFYPDSKKSIWKVKSNNNGFASKFLTNHSSKTVIEPSFDKLTKAILNHFTEYYKSLGEDIIGTGIIIIENRCGTISDLAAWYQSLSNIKINSRSSRVVG